VAVVYSGWCHYVVAVACLFLLKEGKESVRFSIRLEMIPPPPPNPMIFSNTVSTSYILSELSLFIISVT
jgi:hypothetical protein